MSGQTVSAGEAARRLGVAPATIQRWADSGVLHAERTPGGHRRIYVTEVRRLIAAARPAIPSGPLADWLAALLSGDPRKVRATLLAARERSENWAEVADEVASAIAEMGREWEAGGCQIFEEHAATEALRRGIALCVVEMPCPRLAPTVALFTVSGERHTLGLSLAELVFAEAGWRIFWIGEGPPADELGPLVTKLEPDLVVLSASAVMPQAAVAKYQAELVRVVGDAGIELALGGSGAFTPTPRARRLVAFQELQSFLGVIRTDPGMH